MQVTGCADFQDVRAYAQMNFVGVIEGNRQEELASRTEEDENSQYGTIFQRNLALELSFQVISREHL